MNILLTLSYDGSNFYGWQRQKGKRTVQGELEKAISKLINKTVSLRGASRTDAGVHSKGQIALLKENTSIPIEKLPIAINSLLYTKEIVINNAIYVPIDFHPQRNVYKKTYKYYIYNNKFLDPILRNYVEFVKSPLDINNMNLAAKNFVGKFDFKSFCSSKTQSLSTVREIYNLEVYKLENGLICVEVSGNGFLYNMVRIITGTLIEVGLNKKKAEDIPAIINSRDRNNAGKTVSPKGLFLEKVYFDI